MNFLYKFKEALLIGFVPLLFFTVAFLTLSDYGISWDEPIHFHRGQAYLYYILTGKTEYEAKDVRSIYQNSQLTADYFLEKDDGHPPLNGIIASVFNLLFYQKLAILGDIESYHLFNIVSATVLVLVVVLFARQTYGFFSSIVAGLVVASYPLFFAESHFNIKDPAQAAFFSLTIWSFWNSLKKGSWRWFLLSVISFSVALGTKFNILFLPLITAPYLIAKYFLVLKGGFPNLVHKILQHVPRSYILILAASPLLVFTIVFSTWPFLWEDPIVNFISIIRWYKDIGTGTATYGYFIAGGFNLFAPFWIFFTTPPWVLFLTAIGVITAIRGIKEQGWAPLLWLLWFLVPIIRVVVPNTTVYGGVRQILEFLPAMALLSALGAHTLWAHLAYKKTSIFKVGIAVFVLLGFLSHLIIMVKMHPNQNVYFNSLIGGLGGAKEKNIPYSGNSFGNAYLQAVKWLNDNAPAGAKVALVQGTIVNIPRVYLRKDLRFSNSFWSGIYRDGEYMIELTYNDKRFYPYAWDYVEKFLEPVFEVKVDGVAIAKVWKNDFDHTKSSLREKEAVLGKMDVRQGGQVVLLDMREPRLVTRLVITYPSRSCQVFANVSTSIDGEKWLYEEESIPASQLVYREKESLPFAAFFFAGREARYIRLELFKDNSCFFSEDSKFRIYVLEG